MKENNRTVKKLKRQILELKSDKKKFKKERDELEADNLDQQYNLNRIISEKDELNE